MRKFSKIVALLLSVLLVFALTGCSGGEGTASPDSSTKETGSDEVYTITFSHANSKGTSVHDATAEAMKAYIEKESGGRLKMEIYPDGQLGLDREAIEAVQAGTITMMGCSTATQANFVPSAAIFDCPFSVNNVAAAEDMVTNEKMLSLLKEEYKKSGIKLMFLINGCFRNTSSTFPINKPEDFENFKIRTMESPFHLALWKALGANPTPLAASELYTALQQGVVEGQENAYDIACYYSVYEVNPYFSEDCHILAVSSYIMNQEFYDNLPADLQKVIDDAMQVGYKAGTEASYHYNDYYKQVVLDKGGTIYTWPTEDIAILKEKTAEVWDMVKNNEGMNPAVFDAYVAACEEANAANP